jgi:hypothetical protein
MEGCRKGKNSGGIRKEGTVKERRKERKGKFKKVRKERDIKGTLGRMERKEGWVKERTE